MSGVQVGKIDEALKKDKMMLANILIVSKFSEGQAFIQNIFDANIDVSIIKKESVAIRKVDIGEDINLYFSNKESVDFKKLEASKYDFIIYVVSTLSKRIDIKDIKAIEEISKVNKRVILVLSECEYLDERELDEMKENFSEQLEDIEVLSITDGKIECDDNQVAELIYLVTQNLDENCREGFVKAQKIDNKGKKEINNKIIASYIEKLTAIDEEKFDKENILYIGRKLMDDMLSTYACDSEVVRNSVIGALEKSIDNIIKIKKEKLENLIRIYEEEKRKEAEIERIRLEKIKIQEEKKKAREEAKRVEEERKKAEAERIKKEAEEKRKAEEAKQRAEEERVKLEQERVRKEKERIRLEEEKLEKERQKKIKLEEEVAKRAAQIKKKAEETRKNNEKKAKEDREKLEKERQEKLEKDEKQKVEDEKKNSNDDIKEKVDKMKKRENTNLDEKDIIIEASFTVDESEKVEHIHHRNIIEEQVDEILDEIIASKIEELMKGIKEDIKNKLRENNII